MLMGTKGFNIKYTVHSFVDKVIVGALIISYVVLGKPIVVQITN